MREPSMQAMRDIVRDKQAARFRFPERRRGVLVDSFTAGAIVAVYNAANEADREKIARMIETLAGFQRVAAICFKLI